MKAITAAILEDQVELEPGQRLSWRGVLYPPPWDGDRTELSTSLSLLRGTVLALSGTLQGVTHVLGSACLIGPGVAITAVHVVDEFKQMGGFDPGGYVLYAFGIREEAIQFWRVHTITQPDNTDVCLLAMNYASKPGEVISIEFLELTARASKVGERVTVAGFRSFDIEGEASMEGDKPTVQGAFLLGTGRVLDLYVEGRDRWMPQPCFSADLNTVGAMSGGPVFDCRGKLIGVLSTSIQGNETERGVAFITLIVGSLLQKIKLTWPKKYWPDEEKTLIDLLDVDEKWRVFSSPDGLEWKYQYEGDAPGPLSLASLRIEGEKP